METRPVGRPTTRIHRVPEPTLEGLRGVFGASTNAFKNLRLSGLVAYQTFYRAWQGKPVSDRVIRGIEESWERFRREISLDNRVGNE